MGGRTTTLGFGADRFKTVVTTATDISLRLTMEKRCVKPSAFIFDPIFGELADN